MAQQRGTLQTALLWQLLTSLPGKYDEDEKIQHGHTRRLDALGLCIILLLYTSVLGAGEDPWPDTPPLAVYVCQGMASAISIYNLYVEILVLPRGTKASKDDFHVTYGPLGRWVYLTHQTIGVLAIHSTVSLLALLFCRHLAYGTYSATPLIGAAGVFVTVQYFNLVFPEVEHKKGCEVWAERGVRFGFIDSLRHILPILVVIFDVMAKRSEAFAAAIPSALQLLLLTMCYACGFVALTHMNYSITGFWPYSFMKTLDGRQWLVFTLIQGSLLSLCGFSVCLLARLATLW